MNLTKCFVAGLCLTAMTASAVELKANAFEAGEPGTGWSFDGVKDWDTTGVRVDGDASLEGYTAARPMTGVTSNKVLKLDTEGGVWTNTVVDGSFASAPVYADMLVKFVPSEELPSVDSAVKLAIAVTNGYLAVTKDDGLGGNEWVGTSTAIDTSLWYRVTVMLTFDDPLVKATVKINETAVIVEGNTLFDITDNDGFQTLNSIGFQGTGFIDEVVVRDDDPISTAVLLTLSFTAGTDIASVLVGGNPKNSGDTVASGSELVITAAQWKEIADVTGPSTVTWGDSAAGDTCVTVTVANATATTVTITAQTESTSTGTSGTGTSFDGAPMNKVATWALANGVTTLTSGIYDQYLFNLDDAATVPDLLIKSITVSGSTVTVTVEATGINFTTINGTLKLKSYPTLGGAETVHTITFSGTTTAEIVQDIGSNKFVKASVE